VREEEKTMNQRKNIIHQIKRTVLIVEDEFINREILASYLEENYDVLKANNGLEALHLIHESLIPISLILLDINMPIMNGFAFLQEIKKEEKYKKIPVIVLTGEKDSELESLNLGAVDFISKPYNMKEIILARVRRSIELSEDRMIIQAAERDERTGVYNSHIFAEYVNKMDRYNIDGKTDMMVIQIEKMHLFSELHGHERGYDALYLFAKVLKDMALKCDGIVGNYKSEYFMMYLNRQKDYKKFFREVEERFDLEMQGLTFKFKMGVYHVEDKIEPVESRIRRAKLVCDEIINSNKDKVIIYDNERQKNALFRQQLVSDLKQAISEHQFEVYYQPKMNIQGDTPVLSSAEALIRWNHPELDFISPGVFIPLFEENGDIRLLDRVVWQEAARQIRRWKDIYHRTIPVSVNVSRVDLFDPNIAKTFKEIVDEAEISPHDMYLEITESAYGNETDQIEEIVSKLRKEGFKIEVDDFGSGYSSLNAITSLTFDVLKLDMQFVKTLLTNEKTYNMVKIVAEIAKFLNVMLVAEGVETKEQLDILKKLGYQVIQGYYFSKPVRAVDFEKFIKKEDKTC
jgi:EAL domain-containing protein (putative c-di-GMP-specific phosphodiesterase class I)/DNA-binding response OmpR family regulator